MFCNFIYLIIFAFVSTRPNQLNFLADGGAETCIFIYLTIRNALLFLGKERNDGEHLATPVKFIK